MVSLPLPRRLVLRDLRVADADGGAAVVWRQSLLLSARVLISEGVSGSGVFVVVVMSVRVVLVVMSENVWTLLSLQLGLPSPNVQNLPRASPSETDNVRRQVEDVPSVKNCR
jgi:hypothetical protein